MPRRKIERTPEEEEEFKQRCLEKRRENQRGRRQIKRIVNSSENVESTSNYQQVIPVADKYISAEIPDPNDNRVLHDIVMKHMIHGPCGDWCLVNGKCSKHYPKPFMEETRMDEDSYTYYRRRDVGKTFESPGGYIVDNSHVVPYCPILSLIFNSHINVEVVSSIKSVKYLYKGHDAATVTVEPVTEDVVLEHDEIRDYIEARYVGPVEASWRILEKKLQDKSHTVICLSVHLPNEHNITIENESTEEVRMYSVSPTQLELFHLRLLLLTVKGATSFEDLRTVNGEIYPTFTATCLALGLIEDDEEWMRAMDEVVMDDATITS
ncbi:uncharacterized protein LOC116853632 [Odontomachus brunneus]|uniref:uncharacterized protein LOC116853632 n=1 Tax=Odontomachus brunneus TaxID=486640 RepID=UPI0013F20B4D|nr:uncharacterized protein LOC116853632 [Odontomachus brunneus]